MEKTMEHKELAEVMREVGLEQYDDFYIRTNGQQVKVQMTDKFFKSVGFNVISDIGNITIGDEPFMIMYEADGNNYFKLYCRDNNFNDGVYPIVITRVITFNNYATVYRNHFLIY